MALTNIYMHTLNLREGGREGGGREGGGRGEGGREGREGGREGGGRGGGRGEGGREGGREGGGRETRKMCRCGNKHALLPHKCELDNSDLHTSQSSHISLAYTAI